MNLKMLTVGAFFTNCYVVWCISTREAIVIDPGFDRKEEHDKILNVVRKNRLKVKFIVDTHGHPDHTCGNGVIKEATGAYILIHRLDANMLSKVGKQLTGLFGIHVNSPVADGFLEENKSVIFGEIALRVLHTPGHSPGSIALVGDECVFTGDTLFAGSIGRTDLFGGSSKEIMHSLKKLADLPETLTIYTGHGPKSTIGEEKRNNPFLQRNFDDSYFRI